MEIQAARQAEFAERMFVYHYRLFDRYRKPVVSLAVLADAEAPRRPAVFGYERWGCRLAFAFPVAKVLDWRDCWAELERSRNPFAVVTQAHLKTQATRRDPAERYRWKGHILRGLYERGFERQDILELFHFLDGLMRLPEELEERLWSELRAEEEARKMRYVSSVERIGMRRGMERGLTWSGAWSGAWSRAWSGAWNRSGTCCCGWCAAASAKRSPRTARRYWRGLRSRRCWRTWARRCWTAPTARRGWLGSISSGLDPNCKIS